MSNPLPTERPLPREEVERLIEADRRFLWHPFTQMQEWYGQPCLIVAAGDGCHLFDVEGNRYLDGVSSLWANVHGHRRPEIDEAIRKQLDRIAHSTLLGLAHPAAIELARELVSQAPGVEQRSTAGPFSGDTPARWPMLAWRHLEGRVTSWGASTEAAVGSEPLRVLRGVPMGGKSKVGRAALLLVALVTTLLAIWLFFAPFGVRATYGSEGTPASAGSVTGLIGACSPAFRQLISPPAQGLSRGLQGYSMDLTFPNLDPLCRDIGRTRALSSLGFVVAALLALALVRVSRPDPRPL